MCARRFSPARILEVFELEGARWTLLGTYGDEATARIRPFVEVELPVGRLSLPRSEGAGI
jgi:hypothetical protein